MVTAFSLGLGLYITNVGCGGGPVRQTLNSSNVKLQYLKQALLVTDGVKIEFVEDGKSITSGEPFLPTSYVPRAPVENDVSSASLRSYIEAQGYYGVDFAQSSVGRVWIRHVTPDSPAANAGLRFAEIYEINGEDVDTVSDVWARFNEARRDVPVNESTRVKGPDLEVTLMAAESPKPAKVLVHVPGRSQPLYGRIAFSRCTVVRKALQPVYIELLYRTATCKPPKAVR
jgi:hypothetical protein